MFIPAVAGAVASTFSAEPTPESAPEPTTSPSANLPCTPAPTHIRYLILGTPSVVQATIRLLHQLGYAEPNDWSRLISTGRVNEVMAILTKRVGAS